MKTLKCLSAAWASPLSSQFLLYTSIWMPDWYLTFHMTKTELITSPILTPTKPQLQSSPIKVNCTSIHPVVQIKKIIIITTLPILISLKHLVPGRPYLSLIFDLALSIRVSDLRAQGRYLFCSPLYSQHPTQCLICGRHSISIHWLTHWPVSMVLLLYFRMCNIIKDVMWLQAIYFPWAFVSSFIERGKWIYKFSICAKTWWLWSKLM